MSINNLPSWCYTDTQPAAHDHESLTAIEMVSRLYGKMQELVNEYNKWIDETNLIINDFNQGMYTDYNAFKIAVQQQFNNFIDIVDLKIKGLNSRLSNLENALTKEIIETATQLLSQLIDAGKIALEPTTTYDNKELTLSMSVSMLEV